MSDRSRINRLVLTFSAMLLLTAGIYWLGLSRSGVPLFPGTYSRVNSPMELAGEVTRDLQRAAQIGSSEPGTFSFWVTGNPPEHISYYNHGDVLYRAENGTANAIAEGVFLQIDYSADSNMVTVRIYPGESAQTGSGVKPLYERQVFIRKLQTAEKELTAWINWPERNRALRGEVTIRGTAAGPGFQIYVLEYFSGNSLPNLIVSDTQQVSKADNLGVWDTANTPDGPYTLRLRVASRDGHQEIFSIPVVVRNAQ